MAVENGCEGCGVRVMALPSFTRRRTDSACSRPSSAMLAIRKIAGGEACLAMGPVWGWAQRQRQAVVLSRRLLLRQPPARYRG